MPVNDWFCPVPGCTRTGLHSTDHVYSSPIQRRFALMEQTYNPQGSPAPSASPLTHPDVRWRWGKWTFGVWTDAANHTKFGIDIGPLEIVWRSAGYRP